VTFRATHRLVHRETGVAADDLMEISPGVYVAEAALECVATVDPSMIPSFGVVPIDAATSGRTIAFSTDRGVLPGAPGTETRTRTSTAEEDGCLNIGPHGKHWLWAELQKLWPDIDDGEYRADAYFRRIVRLIKLEKEWHAAWAKNLATQPVGLGGCVYAATSESVAESSKEKV